MLCEVVSAVEFPEEADVVHETVVPVEPEVENDTVEADLKWQHGPVQLGGEPVDVVGEVDGEGHTRAGRLVEGCYDFGDADVRDAVAVVLVTVEEAVDVAQTAEDVDFEDDDGVESHEVEVEDGYWA